MEKCADELCTNCALGLCELCNECTACQTCNPSANTGSQEDVSGQSGSGVSESTIASGLGLSKEETNDRGGVNSSRKGPRKAPSAIKDPKSTGRKRAVLVAPIKPGALCEWAGYINCGGGERPIIGCSEGIQENVHHGPNKDTLVNTPENLHRICPGCHNVWHSQNDPGYNWEAEFYQPHAPERATLRELAFREVYRIYTMKDVPEGLLKKNEPRVTLETSNS